MAKRNFIIKRLTEIVEACPTGTLLPKSFFVSWHGVMTIAYEGFCKCILDLKENLEERFPIMPIEKEGSKWAKTTIGALKEGRTLTLDELKCIKGICDKHDDGLAKCDTAQFAIDALSYVEYECRSLEKVANCNTMQLKPMLADEYEIPEDHLKSVQSVIEQFSTDNMECYIEAVQKDGHREPHYRSHRSGAALVYQLPENDIFNQQVDRFIADVDTSFPGRYAWFDPKCRHVTIRAL